MNRAQLLALTSAIQAIRHDWDHSGILWQLTKLETQWAGTDGELAVHAMTIAADPQSQTPGAINHRQASPKPRPELLEKEPLCYICGNTKTRCQNQQDFEIEHGIPDPHVYETAQDAETNATPITPARKAAIMNKISGLLKNVNDEPGMKHAVETQKAKEKA